MLFESMLVVGFHCLWSFPAEHPDALLENSTINFFLLFLGFDSSQSNNL